ncbi:hypothetical protein STEG23_021714 [Scotinomys teguina]
MLSHTPDVHITLVRDPENTAEAFKSQNPILAKLSLKPKVPLAFGKKNMFQNYFKKMTQDVREDCRRMALATFVTVKN